MSFTFDVGGELFRIQYLLLAAIHHACQPGPKTEAADGIATPFYLRRLGFPAERFTSKEMCDVFDRIRTAYGGKEDELEQAQYRLRAVWRGQVSGE